MCKRLCEYEMKVYACAESMIMAYRENRKGILFTLYKSKEPLEFTELEAQFTGVYGEDNGSP